MAAGKELRKKIPRAVHGDFNPSPDRVDPIAILEKQAKTRLPFLVPIRYARMLESPFAFLRGGAAIMAADLAPYKTTGIDVQTCGDMHVANFGLYASVERNLIFGINDFDETIPGPWEWDLKRLATSAVTSCRFLGGDVKLCEEAARSAVKSYRKKMKQYAYMGNLDLWYSSIKDTDILSMIPHYMRKNALHILSKARTHTNIQVLENLTDIIDKKHKLRINEPFMVRETKTMFGRTIIEALDILMEDYSKSLANDRRYLLGHYKVADAVRKVVGVGSVGTRCWVVYLEGSYKNDPLFLQIKEAQPSVYASDSISLYKNEGERVVAGQRLLQGSADIFLGWAQLDGTDYYIRQLHDMKGGLAFDPHKLVLSNYHEYTALCGWALALAHAKSGDAAMIAGYAGNSNELDDAMVRFAFAYDKLTISDHKALVAAAESGRIKVSKETE
ncbi:MAG: DUF2252 domain-containing protein [Chitinophagales bacterium]|nr:DUF2252 domain-containing protein [Chitinophagales bacterium]